jgi:hypothetical protein
MDATTATQARAEHQRRHAVYVRHLDRCRRCQSTGRPAVLAQPSIAASWRQSGVGYDAGDEGMSGRGRTGADDASSLSRGTLLLLVRVGRPHRPPPPEPQRPVQQPAERRVARRAL